MVTDKRLDELLIELRGAPHPENEGQKEVAELIALARVGLRYHQQYRSHVEMRGAYDRLITSGFDWHLDSKPKNEAEGAGG